MKNSWKKAGPQWKEPRYPEGQLSPASLQWLNPQDAKHQAGELTIAGPGPYLCPFVT